MWLLERNLRAVGYVRAEPPPLMLDPIGFRAPLLDRAHQAGVLAPASSQSWATSLRAGILVALAIGDQPAIAPGEWTVFTRTGVNHLMSISGLHITMVSGLVFAVVAWCWRRMPAATARLPAHSAGALAGLSAALFYALVSGFGVPAQRTVFMLAVVAVALLKGRATSVAGVLTTALFVVLVMDPWAMQSAGFWLSFGAVALILYVGAGRLQRPGWLVDWARIQWAITLGLVPLLLVLFKQVSLVSPIANAVAIPVVSLGVVPLTLLGLLLPIDALLVVAGKLMELCYWFLHALSALPEAVWQQAAPPAWTLPVALIGRSLAARSAGLSGPLAGPGCAAAAGRRARGAASAGKLLARCARCGAGARCGRAHRRPHIGVRHRPRLFQRRRQRQQDRRPLSARRGGIPAGWADRQPQRQRPQRRHGFGAAGIAGRLGGILAAGGQPAACAGAAATALLRGPALGMGWRALRDAPPVLGQL